MLNADLTVSVTPGAKVGLVLDVAQEGIHCDEPANCLLQ